MNVLTGEAGGQDLLVQTGLIVNRVKLPSFTIDANIPTVPNNDGT
jgi:hypothetical protein